MLEVLSSWYSEYLEKLSSLEAFALVIVLVVFGAGVITAVQSRRQ
jgi:hypothetical protein